MTTLLPRRSLAVPLAVAALLWAPLAAPAQEGGEAAGAAEVAVALPAITVAEVRAERLRDRVVASGLVAAIEEVQVQPLVEGQPIDALLADVGDRVEAGQVLARLSTSTLDLELSQLAASRASGEASIAQSEASLAQAAATAAEAERVAARNAQLARDGTVPQTQVEQSAASAEAAQAAVRVAEQGIVAAQAQLELVEAQVANAELQISRTEVTAPVDGLVVARNAQVGAIASAAGEAMFTLVRDGAMEMRADLSEQDLLRVAAGQAAMLVNIGGGEPLAGTVRLVEPTIDPATRLGRARIAIDDPSRVVEGMFLTAEILVREDEVLAVPATAVGTGAEGSSVMRVRDGVVERVPVTTSIRDGALIGISEGLEAGDLVVAKAGAFVREGDRIEPVEAEGDAGAGAEAAADTVAQVEGE